MKAELSGPIKAERSAEAATLAVPRPDQTVSVAVPSLRSRASGWRRPRGTPGGAVWGGLCLLPRGRCGRTRPLPPRTPPRVWWTVVAQGAT